VVRSELASSTVGRRQHHYRVLAATPTWDTGVVRRRLSQGHSAAPVGLGHATREKDRRGAASGGERGAASRVSPGRMEGCYFYTAWEYCLPSDRKSTAIRSWAKRNWASLYYTEYCWAVWFFNFFLQKYILLVLKYKL
jgi:hypothetical protein